MDIRKIDLEEKVVSELQFLLLSDKFKQFVDDVRDSSWGTIIYDTFYNIGAEGFEIELRKGYSGNQSLANYLQTNEGMESFGKFAEENNVKFISYEWNK